MPVVVIKRDENDSGLEVLDISERRKAVEVPNFGGKRFEPQE